MLSRASWFYAGTQTGALLLGLALLATPILTAPGGTGTPVTDLTPAVATTTDDPSTQQWVMATGTLHPADGTSALRPDDIAVSVALQPATERGNGPVTGETVDLWPLSTDHLTLQASDNGALTFTLTLDPATVPTSHREPGGAVTADLVFTDATTGHVAAVLANARAVHPSPSQARAAARAQKATPGQTLTWADPLAAIDADASPTAYPVLTGTGETTSPAQTAAARQSQTTTLTPMRVNLVAAPKAAERRAAAHQTLDAAARGDGSPATSSGPAARAGGNCYWEKEVRQWATVGTSYPLRRSRLMYSSETSSSFGVATTFGNGWEETSTKSTKDSWGQNFQWRSFNRSFRVQVDYRKQVCFLAHSGYYSHTHAVPVGQPGYNREHRLAKKAPKFTHCGPIAGGEWWRGKVRGTDYQLDYGVKSGNWIGISMTSKRAYSEDGKLSYKFPKARVMCGSNNDAAYARTVRERRKMPS